jgi:acetoacetyl-CoA reductase
MATMIHADPQVLEAPRPGVAVEQHEAQIEGRRSSLRGAVVVVTGAARGIGRAIAEDLARCGARVVVNYAHSKDAAEALVHVLKDHGAEGACAVGADVADPVQALHLIEETLGKFDRIDALVNNAGITADRSLKNMSIDEWDNVVRTNLSSCFYMVKAALPSFIQQKYGTIVNISSFVGQKGNFGQANYAASKAGIIGFTKAAALELARNNITINAVCPGFIETDMFKNVPPAAKETLIKQIPLGRIGTPAEVARCVRYLIEDGGYITGQCIGINGGIYM